MPGSTDKLRAAGRPGLQGDDLVGHMLAPMLPAPRQQIIAIHDQYVPRSRSSRTAAAIQD